MQAGTIALLDDPAEEPLDTTFRAGELPGIEVEATQERVDGTPVQQGQVAANVEVNRQNVRVGSVQGREDPTIYVETLPERTQVVADWVADVTGSGLIAASSTGGDGELDFPFDVFAAATDRMPQRVRIDVEAMHDAWAGDDTLGSVWMTGTEDDEDATEIQYHDAATVETRPTIGLGFNRSWGGRVLKGVVYASGYVAVYNADTGETFAGFVEDCVLPFVEVETSGPAQQTLGG